VTVEMAEGKGKESKEPFANDTVGRCYVMLRYVMCYVMCYVVVGDLLHFGRWQEQ